MKSVLIRTGLPLSIAIAAFLLVVPVVSHAQAKAPTPTPSKTPPAPAAATGGYTYVAQPGDSLSVLVRKSLQLYDGEQKDIQLSEAAAMYAETNVVQKMGANLLNLGQTVTVNKADLASFCVASKALTPQQIAAWQQYANMASFDLPNIKPTSGAAAVATPSRPNPAPATPTKPTPTPATPSPTPQSDTKEDTKDTPEASQTNEEAKDSSDDSAATADSSQKDDQATDSKNNAPWYWWLVGAGTLGILYYLLSGRQATSTKK